MGDVYLAPLFQQLLVQIDPKMRNTAHIRSTFDDLEAVLGTMTNYVEGPDYAVGERLSLADCALAPFFFFIDIFLARTFDLPSPLRGSMKLYYDNSQKDPHIARAIREMNAALDSRLAR
jgi:glutathione S-transferase